MKFKIQFFIATIFLLMLNSCTIPTGFYMQNLTNRSISLKILFQKPPKEYIIGQETNFYSIPEISSSKDLKNKKNATKLEFSKIDDKTFQIILPPNSTTEIEKTKNFNYNIDLIEFDGKKRNLGELIVNSMSKKDNYIYQIKN